MSTSAIPPSNTSQANNNQDILGQSSIGTQTLNQSDFLSLLVAQLSSQDPMNPVSNTDFFGQMAQFSGLQQTQTMQTDLAGIRTAQDLLQASGMLGKTVLVQSSDGSTASGVVSAVGIQDNTPTLLVGNQSYTLSQVLGVSLTASDTASTTRPNKPIPANSK